MLKLNVMLSTPITRNMNALWFIDWRNYPMQING